MPHHPLRRRSPLYSLAGLLAFGGFLMAQPGEPQDKTPVKAKSITTVQGKVGDLLRQWYKEGTAAGNDGDYYDNRDGAHSDLDTAPYPQLKRIVYSLEDIKLRKHWAAAHTILPHVVFGNSSTSAPPLAGGSNPRMYYTSGRGLAFLYEQYAKNNLYMYPEHRDHDPGHNGPDEGFGDLYPTNTPYLLISQGSSGSDQPFMRALPLTLAAFRPEVKKKLIETGLLMPTIQMLLRTTNKNLKDPKEYLTGKGQPTVFEGNWVDELALVQGAHAIEAGNIPPMVQLKVLEEEEPSLGKDFFEPRGGERLADTPAVIARIFRGKNMTRRIVVSAEASYDINKKPLSFTWVVLRGDAKGIKITPLNKEQTKAEIVIPWPERRPVEPGSTLESNRIDIGVFVHNGVHYSAPGFITYYSLDHESRTYDAKGRILELGYGFGETKPNIRDWPMFCAVAGSEKFAEVLGIGKEQRELLLNVQPKIKDRQTKIDAARAERGDLDKTLQTMSMHIQKLAAQNKELEKKWAETKDPAVKVLLDKGKEDHDAHSRKREMLTKERQVAEKQVQAEEKGLADFLDEPRQPAKQSLRSLGNSILQRSVADLGLFTDRHGLWKDLAVNAPPPRRTAVETARQRLVMMGLAKETADKSLSLDFLQGKQPTPFEKMLVDRFHAALLENLVFPGALTFTTPTNVTDERLSAPRFWRDVYRYDAKGTALGWTRFDGTAVHGFNQDGYVIVEKDDLGRCLKARTVRYVQDPPDKFGLNRNPLRWQAEVTVVRYQYAGPEDFEGNVAAKENVPLPK